jgi:hypothetical protein
MSSSDGNTWDSTNERELDDALENIADDEQEMTSDGEEVDQPHDQEHVLVLHNMYMHGTLFMIYYSKKVFHLT